MAPKSKQKQTSNYEEKSDDSTLSSSNKRNKTKIREWRRHSMH